MTECTNLITHPYRFLTLYRLLAGTVLVLNRRQNRYSGSTLKLRSSWYTTRKHYRSRIALAVGAALLVISRQIRSLNGRAIEVGLLRAVLAILHILRTAEGCDDD